MIIPTTMDLKALDSWSQKCSSIVRWVLQWCKWKGIVVFPNVLSKALSLCGVGRYQFLQRLEGGCRLGRITSPFLQLLAKMGAVFVLGERLLFSPIQCLAWHDGQVAWVRPSSSGFHFTIWWSRSNFPPLRPTVYITILRRSISMTAIPRISISHCRIHCRN